MDGAGGGAFWWLLLDAFVFPLLKFFFLHSDSNPEQIIFNHGGHGEKQRKQLKSIGRINRDRQDIQDKNKSLSGRIKGLISCSS
jgi:hypothetical protein